MIKVGGFPLKPHDRMSNFAVLAALLGVVRFTTAEQITLGPTAYTAPGELSHNSPKSSSADVIDQVPSQQASFRSITMTLPRQRPKCSPRFRTEFL